MSDLQKPRKKQFVRRIVLAIAIPVLLLSGYVSSYFGCEWARGYGNMTPKAFYEIERAYRPVRLYLLSQLPFSQELLTFDLWLRSGGGGDWTECRKTSKLYQEEFQEGRVATW